MLPENAEKNLTHLLRTRLRGEALQLLRGNTYDTIINLTKALENIYSPKRTTTELCGELTRLTQTNTESVATYYNRACQLQNKLIDAYKSENNNAIDEARKAEWEQICGKYFVLGLNKEIFPLMKEKKILNVAGPEAIEIENLLRNRNALKPNSYSKDCILCGSCNHTAENCSILSNIRDKSTEILECQLCKRKGHIAKECKNQYFCQLCNKPGHIASACRGDMSNNICQLCKKTGHTAKQCHFSPINIAQPVSVCQTCNKPGHTSIKCYQNIKCNKCGKLGHYANFCRSQITSYCQNCKRTGHNTKDCRTKQKINNQNKQCKFCNRRGHDTQNCFAKIAYDKLNKAPENFQSLPVREASSLDIQQLKEPLLE